MRRALARFLWWKMSFERLLEPRRTLTNPLLLDQLNRLDFGIHIDSRVPFLHNKLYTLKLPERLKGLKYFECFVLVRSW